MNVARLAEQIGTRHGVEHEQARGLVDDVLRALAHAAHTGDELYLPGLGHVTVESGAGQIDDASGFNAFVPSAALNDLQAASDELLTVASRAADNAERLGDEIDRQLGRIRQILTSAAGR